MKYGPNYNLIYKQFLSISGINHSAVSDYRPCIEEFGVPNIDNAIIVWFKNGGKAIYIYESRDEYANAKIWSWWNNDVFKFVKCHRRIM